MFKFKFSWNMLCPIPDLLLVAMQLIFTEVKKKKKSQKMYPSPQGSTPMWHVASFLVRSVTLEAFAANAPLLRLGQS